MLQIQSFFIKSLERVGKYFVKKRSMWSHMKIRNHLLLRLGFHQVCSIPEMEKAEVREPMIKYKVTHWSSRPTRWLPPATLLLNQGQPARYLPAG